MDTNLLLLVLACGAGFFMAWGIGANDVSNAMGTSVGSKAITIRQAIVIAAIFEFLGAFLAGSEVANTIKQNIIVPEELGLDTQIIVIGMLSSLLAAASWLFIASFFGWPVSTTHTIVGAIIGFGASQAGLQAVQWHQVSSIVLGWLLSPCIGTALSFVIFMITHKLILSVKDPLHRAQHIVPFYIFFTVWIVSMITCKNLAHIGLVFTFKQSALLGILFGLFAFLIGKALIRNLTLDPKADRYFHYTNVEKIFGILMLFAACAMAFAHGSNDVANAIGPLAAIVAALQNTQNFDTSAHVPLWVLLLGASGIVLGLSMYGHKVMATVGKRITQLTPSRGFAATMAAATTVVLASDTGLPISTTHTLVGGILGVGLARGMGALNLNVIKTIFISWLVTLPAGAFLAVGFCKLLLKVF